MMYLYNVTVVLITLVQHQYCLLPACVTCPGTERVFFSRFAFRLPVTKMIVLMWTGSRE